MRCRDPNVTQLLLALGTGIFIQSTFGKSRHFYDSAPTWFNQQPMTDPWDWYVYLHVPSCTYMKTIKNQAFMQLNLPTKTMDPSWAIPAIKGWSWWPGAREALAQRDVTGWYNSRGGGLNPKLKKTCQKGEFSSNRLKTKQHIWNHDHKLNERHRILVKYGDDDFIILNTSIKNQQYVTHFLEFPSPPS